MMNWLHSIVQVALLATVALPVSPQADSDQVDALAERVIESQDWHQRVQLAQLAKRRDTAGTLWWFEIEVRARRAAGEPTAVVRLITDALSFPLTAPDQAQLLGLRAEAYGLLEDNERQLADLLRASSLDPSAAHLRSQSGILLAKRLDLRRQTRAVREAREEVGLAPLDPRVKLNLARTLANTPGKHEARLLFQEVLEATPQELRANDAIAAAEIAEDHGEYDLALAFLAVDALADQDLALDAWRAEIATARDQAAAWDESDGGYGYGYGFGYGELEGDVEAPGDWTIASLEALADRFEEALNQTDGVVDLLLEEMWALEAELAQVETELAQLDQAAIAGRRASTEAQIARVREYQARADAFEAAESLLNGSDAAPGLGAWGPWADGQLEDPEAAQYAAASRLADAYWTWIERPALYPVQLLPRAEGLIDAALVAARARAEWQAALQALLADRESAAPQELAERAATLLASGPPRAELLVLSALAELELSHVYVALPRLHLGVSGLLGEGQSATSELPAATREALLASANAALRVCAEMAASNAQATRLALDIDLLDQARGFAERAADLDPGNAGMHALEGEVLAKLGESAAALDAYRLASHLAPEDSLIAAAHGAVALEARALTEALLVAEQRVNAAPRDPAALNQRSLARRLLGWTEAARADRMFAYEMTGREHLDMVAPQWMGLAGTRTFLKNSYGNLSVKGVGSMGGTMPWVPEGGRQSAAGDAVAALLFGIVDEQREVSELDAALPEFSARDARAWPGVAAFYRGEIELYRGNWQAAKAAFAAALRDAQTPALIANLAAERNRAPLRVDARPSHLPLHVPKDFATLDEALAAALPGQTILLGEGTFGLDQHLTQSVRIVGSGSATTQIRVRAPSGSNSNRDLRVEPRVAEAQLEDPTAVAPTSGWVEFADLELNQYDGDGSDLVGNETRRIVVTQGTLSLERVGLKQGTALEVRTGASLSAVECDWSPSLRAPLLVSGGSVYLDQVVLGQSLQIESVQERAEVSADRLTLVQGGALQLKGQGANLIVRSMTALGTAPVLVDVRAGATAQIAEAFWRAAADQVFIARADGGIAKAASVMAISSLGADLGDTAESSNVLFESTTNLTTRDLRPMLVNDVTELKEALEGGYPWIQLEPGDYVTEPLAVHSDVVIESQPGFEGGAALSLREDWGQTLFTVAAGVECVVRNLHLGTRGWRPAEAGSAIAKAGGAYMVEPAFETYTLLENRGGKLWLDRVTQSREGTGNLATRVLTVRAMGPALTVATGLLDGSALDAQGSARTWALDGGFRDVELSASAEATLLGRGQLAALRVSGKNTRLVLDDLRPERIPFVAFTDGARDPRSEVRRARDGIDPLVFQTAALERATLTWLDPLTSTASLAERATAWASYAGDYARALRYSIADRDERYRQAAEQVLAEAAGDTLLLQAIIGNLSVFSSDYGVATALYSEMSPADYQALIGRNRAEAELGADATEQELSEYADWEAALLAGRVSPEQKSEGKRLGMNYGEYQQELLRRKEVAASREREAEKALASGNLTLIRSTLKAYSLERWLEFVATDDSVSLGDINDAIASGTWSKWYGPLVNKRDAREREQASQPGHTYSMTPRYSSNRGGNTNEFQNWLTERAIWNDRMDRNLKAISNSSYSSYRNSYDY